MICVIEDVRIQSVQKRLRVCGIGIQWMGDRSCGETVPVKITRRVCGIGIQCVSALDGLLVFLGVLKLQCLVG